MTEIIKSMQADNKPLDEIIQVLQAEQVKLGYPASPSSDWALFIERNIK